MWIETEGRFLIGWNYWSRAGGPRMWDRFDATVVDAEVAQMRSMGANLCRSFLFLPSFMPTPPAVSKRAVDRFLKFLEICERQGLRTMPTLLVGHMSGENHDFPGQKGRSPYTDLEVRSWTRALVDAVVGAARRHPAVAGWVLSNEMPLWGGKSDAATIRAWAADLIDRIRSLDPGRPVGVGDGVMNAKGGQNGFDAPTLAPLCDWIGPHTYHGDIDSMRHGLQTEALVRGLEHLGRPVLLEEFGCSSTQASEPNAAGYFRETIHGLFSMGAAGAVAWCFGDLDDLAGEPPYDHHAFELGFGSFHEDGTPKATAREILALSRLAATLDGRTLRFPAPRAAIVVPSYFHHDYPFSWEDRGRMRLCLLESYALAARAGIETTLIPEGHDLGPFDLVIVPSMQKLREPSWRALEARVRAGAVAWVSYFGGDHSFHQGMWWRSFERMTGLRHSLRYGLPDDPGESIVIDDASVRVPQGGPFSSAFLPVEPAGAEVVLRDARGRIALAKNPLGSGALFFCPFPIEHYLSRIPDVHRQDRMWLLYARAAREAKLGALADAGPRRSEHHPWVQARPVGAADRELLWLINRSDRPATVRLAGGPQARVFPDEGPAGDSVDLGPKGVVVLTPVRA
ncbi:MAG: hypothetical protein HYY06_32195 [Deltaproteobacteria bacterium]|nr:hypothetical protein [Deltaproteobacteria bacterium]